MTSSNSKVFFYFQDGKILACRSNSQEYFELEVPDFLILLDKSRSVIPEFSEDYEEVQETTHVLGVQDISKGVESSLINPYQKIPLIPLQDDQKIINDLLEGNLLLGAPESFKSPWRGDPASYYAHQSTRMLSQDLMDQDSEAFTENFVSFSQNAHDIPDSFEPMGIEDTILPDPVMDDFKNATFFDVIQHRKTSRNFEGTALSFEKISSLLYFCLGPIHGEEWTDFKTHSVPSYGFHRAAPSTTGLQGCDAFLIVKNVPPLDPGIYFYKKHTHTLSKIESGLDDHFLSRATANQFWADDLSAGIFLVNDLGKIWVKNPTTRGYVMSYMDAGHLSQTILLAATALGFHTWMTGAFRDDYVSEKLQLDCTSCFVSFFIGLGQGSNTSIPGSFLEYLKK